VASWQTTRRNSYVEPPVRIELFWVALVRGPNLF
jgi:hypothetical protein